MVWNLGVLVLGEIEPGREELHLGFDSGDAGGIGRRGGVAGGLLGKCGDCEEQQRTDCE